MRGRLVGFSSRDVWGDFDELQGIIDDAYDDDLPPGALDLMDEDEIEESTENQENSLVNKFTEEDEIHQMKSYADRFAAYFNLGVDRRQLGDTQGAIDAWTQAININSWNAHTYYYRGISKAEIGDYRGAIDDLNRAICIQPHYLNAYRQREKAYEKLENAIREIHNLDNATAYYQQGETYLYSQNYEQAIELFTKAISLNSNIAEAYYYRGISYQNLKFKQNAVEDFQKAAQILCDNNKTRELATWTPYQLGESNRKEAITYLLKHLSQGSPNDKRLAASAIGKLAQHFQESCNSAIPYLLSNLNCPEPQVREYTLKTLNMMTLPSSAISIIQSIADRDPETYNRKRAKILLKKFRSIQSQVISYHDPQYVNSNTSSTLYVYRAGNNYVGEEYFDEGSDYDTSMDYGYLNDISEPYEYFHSIEFHQ